MASNCMVITTMKLLISTLILTVSINVLAHQTETIHPQITQAAIEFIHSKDARNIYGELYQYTFTKRTNDISGIRTRGPQFTGTSKWVNATQSVAQETAQYPAFQHRDGDLIDGSLDMMDGVVWEDIQKDKAHQRVNSHFYHAYNGTGLWLTGGTSSRLRGEKYFAESIALMGFIDEIPINRDKRFWRKDNSMPPVTDWDNQQVFDKQLSYFMFGFSLHHAEDMSSLGHVHDDAHMDIADAPRDDYEAVYVPYHAWKSGSASWFMRPDCASCEDVVVRSFEDIWPARAAFSWGQKSLVRRIYNGSIFRAKIPNSNLSSFWNIGEKPSGELIDMFGFSDTPGDNGNYFTRLINVPSFSSAFIMLRGDVKNATEWVLKSPNKILEIGDRVMSDDIWPVQKISDDESYWYIEDHIPANKSDGHNEIECENILSSPHGIRRDLLSPYDKETNKLVENDLGGCHNTLLGRFADEFMPLAIRYAAEYTKWWFDVANSPPYLRRITVEQEIKLAAVQGQTEPEKRRTRVYDARWRSEYKDGTYDETQWLNTGDAGILAGNLRYKFPFRYVSNRVLKQKEKLDRGALTSAFPIDLILEFNEPMQINPKNGKCNPADGFYVGFEPVSKDSSDHSDIWLTPYMSDISCEEINKDADDVMTVDDKGRLWKVTIPVEVMDKFEALKSGGPMRLIVRAKDKNNHSGDDDIDFGESAGSLDVTPNTPARRNVFRSGRLGSSPTDVFPWHKHDSKPDQQLFPGTKEGDFDYDVYDKNGANKLGDRNHILLFSRAVDKTLFENLKDNVTHDTVSTTLEPKKQEKTQ